MHNTLSPELLQHILTLQRQEITEHHIYKKLAEAPQQRANRATLQKIAEDELRHYHFWRALSGQDISPDWGNIRRYTWISKVLGITFGIKLMEAGEEDAQEHYESLRGIVPDIETLIQDENQHEATLLELIDEERLEYAGSVVLGLNDALVELTGALAGFTLALQNASLIAITGLITGIAAALSMAASEYLSTKAEQDSKEPGRAALYTGSAYLATVVILILPFLLLPNYYVSLAITLVLAVLIIAGFNYYLAVARDLNFRRQFREMALISLGVAAFSFLIGFLLRSVWGIDI